MRLASTLYISLVLSVVLAAFATPSRAADLPAPPPVVTFAPPSFALTSLYARIGVTGAFIDGSMTATIAGQRQVGGGGTIAPMPVSYIEGGYFVTRAIAVSVSAGFPPHLAAYGTGTFAPFGRLYATTTGIPTATVHYHLDFGRLHPYLGGGVGYAINFHNSPAALLTPDLRNAFAPVLVGGFDVDITRHISLFFDVKKIWLSQKLTGGVAPFPGVPVTLPVVAWIRTDPLLTTAGFGYHF